MEYLYFTLAIYFSLALALGFGLWLYLATRRQIRRLHNLLEALERRIGPPPVSTAALQAMGDDIHERGASEIASKLNAPLAEIELAMRLVKPPPERVELRA